jgi:hypothetical protein
VKPSLRTALTAAAALCAALAPFAALGDTHATPAHPAPRPGPPAQGPVEGDAAPPPYDQAAHTELTIELTWRSADLTERAHLCAGRFDHDIPAIDYRLATRLLKEKCATP